MFYTILLYLTKLFGFFPIILYYIRKDKNAVELKFILPFIWLLAIANLYEIVATGIFHINSDVMFRTYNLLDFICLNYFFYMLLKQKYKWLFVAFIIPFCISFIYLALKWKEIDNHAGDSYLSVIETIFVFTFVILWFREIFLNLEVESLTKQPSFYFVSGIVFYFSGTLFLFLMSSSIMNAENVAFRQYWIINIVLSLLLRILLTIGIWKGQK